MCLCVHTCAPMSLEAVLLGGCVWLCVGPRACPCAHCWVLRVVLVLFSGCVLAACQALSRVLKGVPV